tara:strand:+ start:549 stop:1787 length:1239 start_codon:yes stop_codon:yes gene_type:complete
MAINLTKVLTQIQNRISDSATSALDLNKLIAVASRINNSGTQVLTYQSTGQLPSLADSSYIGVIARVASDNVFGDSDGRYYYASGTDSGWRGFKTTQDSAEAAIAAPGGGGAAPSGSQVQGSAYGFRVGGEVPSDGTSLNIIDRYSFTSDGNATDYGDLTVGRGSYLAGCTENDNYGYAAGGYAPTGNTNIIDRFPYASAANAADVGDLSHSGYGKAGCSSTTHGYAIGGTPAVEVIDKFPFAASANASDIGDFASSSRYYLMSASSSTTAYAVGGNGHYSVEKVPFTSDGSMTNITGLTLTPPSTYSAAANSSETHGYTAGGYQGGPTQINTIQKFPFAAEDAFSDVGDLTRTTANQAGSNSTTHGYVHGGQNPSVVNIIEKYSYSADGNSTDVGDLTTISWYSAQGGIQV